MRNLKRALSLTLASVMLLGMMVMGSSALSFNDADDISNVTAATVLEELEVMQGDGRGNFMPEQPVTRAQMAILICRILYGDKLNVTQFSGVTQYNDVAANDYYTGYINLATQLGIINGYGDGRFGPDDTVTTAQAALMLCRALGYFKANELATGDWALASVAQATKIEMFGSLKLNTNDLLARDNVAEMVFNTITKAVPVHYSERWDVYYTDSQSILNGVNFNYRNTLGYENFDLVYNDSKSDDFGRPATEWGIGTVKSVDDKGHIDSATIKTSFLKAADEADASYTKEVKAKDLYSDLDLDETTSASVIIDGKDADKFSISKSGETKIGGNGVLLDAYKDEDNKVTITVINPYVGEISRVTPAKGNDARTVKVDTFGKAFETEGFEEDDIVVYTVADGEIKTMYLANTVTDVEVTRAKNNSADTSNNEFVADGDTYKYATSWAKVDSKTDLVDDKSDVKKENRLDLYLDRYGYVVKVDLSEGSTDYAYVLKTDVDEGKLFSDGTPYAKLLLSDGTEVEAELDFDDYKGLEKTKSALQNKFENKIVEYSKDSKDVYELEVMQNGKADAKKVTLTSGEKITIDSGKAKMTLGDKTVYADSKTVFLTDDGDDGYAAYVGYDAVPNLEGVYSSTSKANPAYAYYCESGNVATVVYILNIDASTDDIVFLLTSECSGKITTKGGDDYYECPAVVNGEIVTVKLNQSVKNSKKMILLKTIVYDNEKEEIIDIRDGKSKPYSTNDNDDNYYVSGEVAKKLTNGNLTIGGASYRVDNDAEVFVYDDEIETSSRSSVAVGDFGYFVINDGKIVTIFYKEAEDQSGEDNEDNDTKTEGIATVPGNMTAEVTVDDNGNATITLDGSKVDATVPKDQITDMNGLFGDAVVDKVSGGVKAEYGIITVDVLANAAKAPYYTIIQTNDSLKELFSGDNNIKGNVKTKTYGYADLKDGLSLVVKSSRGATLVVTPVLDSEGKVKAGDTIVIDIENNATFAVPEEAKTSADVQNALKDKNTTKVEVTGKGVEVTGTDAIEKPITVKEGADLNLKGASTVKGTITVEEGAQLILSAAVTFDKGSAIDLNGGTLEVKANVTSLPKLTGNGTVTIDSSKSLGTSGAQGDQPTLKRLEDQLGLTAETGTTGKDKSVSYTLALGGNVKFAATDGKLNEFNPNAKLSDLAKRTDSTGKKNVVFIMITAPEKIAGEYIVMYKTESSSEAQKYGGESYANWNFGTENGQDEPGGNFIIPVTEDVTEIILTPNPAEGESKG